MYIEGEEFMQICKRLTEIEYKENHYCIKTNTIELRIWFLTDDILRIRAGFDGDFKEDSYSLVMTAWKDRMDSFLGSKRKRINCADSTMWKQEDQIVLQGAKLKVIIEKDPFRIVVFDQDEHIIHSDIPDLAYIKDNNNRRLHTSEISSDDYFYGFGEKTGELNKAETFMSMNPKDAMGYNPKTRDSLYKHIPFYIKLNKISKKATGYFYHNTYTSDFDMGKEHSNYWKPHSRYRTDGGDIDLFLITGPQIREVIERYTDLTGKSVLLPRYALGYLGSSMYYAELSKDADNAILDFVDTSREEGIPIDGFQLSSGFCNIETSNGLKRCVFTWNEKRFKNPANFFKQMNDKNVTVSPNVKPGILLVHPRYEEMKQKGMFIKDPITNEPGIGTWWGGKGSYIDFTNASVRESWKEMLKEAVIDRGTSSVWNDNCEYDGLIDDDLVVDFEGEQTSITKARTSMANIMCQVTEEAISESYPEERPFIVCRAGQSGIQRYAQTWAGDNRTSWDSLKYNIATILGMGMSGVANHGCDITGFHGPSPDQELLVRWVQHGIFQPRFSIHSTNNDNTVTEPWMYQDQLPLVREAIQFRYQMSPYLYSLMERAHRRGLPIMESLVSAFQHDSKTYNEGEIFMFGDALLVANIIDKGQETKEIYLPENEVFYDFYTREKYAGGQIIKKSVDISSIPLFIKGGSIIPMAVDKVSSLKNSMVKEMNIICSPDKSAQFELYEDDGKSFNYKDGEYLRTIISMESGERTILNFEYNGHYQTSVEKMNLDIIRTDKAPVSVMIAEENIPSFLHYKKYEKAKTGWYYNQSLKSVQVKYPNINYDYTVELNFKENDLIGM